MFSWFKPGKEWIYEGFKQRPHIISFPIFPIFNVDELMLSISVHTIFIAFMTQVIVSTSITSVSRPILKLSFAQFTLKVAIIILSQFLGCFGRFIADFKHHFFWDWSCSCSQYLVFLFSKLFLDSNCIWKLLFLAFFLLFLIFFLSFLIFLIFFFLLLLLLFFFFFLFLLFLFFRCRFYL